MSHDLAVYVGAHPSDAAEAMAAFDRLSGTTGQASPPSAPIHAFLDDLARVLPDDHEAWASPPPAGEADGDTLVLPLAYGDGLERTLVTIVDLAHQHGLVCIDLSAEDVYLPMDDGSAYADHLDVLERPADQATDVYARFIRGVISPELRRLGCRGSAGKYRLKDTGDDYALVGFQKGHDNSAWEVTFTINLVHVSADAWAAARREHSWLTKHPSHLGGDPVGWHERIGMLDDPPADRWWALRTQDDVPEVTQDVVRLLRDEAIPELRRQVAGDPTARPMWH
ncbi:DUF4304 domain-containing protein [Pseudokineococcus marinus]|uniref:DUF4304 domain-containing protein n=1 Tax=Pseudokineococcus marinus TaxID=351215 RepID=A0A849BHV5_9ACTN|nr:DUF4304 domain-containing protein [Pseudokineococcus marinus]NNH22151.1 DUF4304 domain-containing protein [Pseudokineococcus marinus]